MLLTLYIHVSLLLLLCTYITYTDITFTFTLHLHCIYKYYFHFHIAFTLHIKISLSLTRKFHLTMSLQPLSRKTIGIYIIKEEPFTITIKHYDTPKIDTITVWYDMIDCPWIGFTITYTESWSHAHTPPSMIHGQMDFYVFYTL